MSRGSFGVYLAQNVCVFLWDRANFFELGAKPTVKIDKKLKFKCTEDRNDNRIFEFSFFWHFEPNVSGIIKKQSPRLAKLHSAFHEESSEVSCLIQIGGFPQFRQEVQTARPKLSAGSTRQLSTCPEDH